jgi:hypothetical protein
MVPGPDSNGMAMAIFKSVVSLALLAGCSQPPAVTGSPQIGSPAASGNTGRNAIGAGSFPRSFLIPGTDTSIRIGG